jgi:transposase
MKRTKRVFSSAFKAEVALEAIKGVKTVSELAQEYELHPAPEREGFEPSVPY